jgi:branched-chain amino acid transport system substrate-binding protein
MQKLFMGLAALASVAVAVVGLHPAIAQDTIKIALIMCYSGQFADTATEMDDAIKLYMQQNGDTIAGKKIELIRKDTGGIAPDVAKRLAQEAVVRDHADILAGWVLTPNALAGAAVSQEAKKFMVVMNAATSVIITKSPYMVRTSSTTPQLNYTFGQWAVKNGSKKIYTMVSDYGPGIDAETWFQKGVRDAGGEIVGSVRFPVANPDFSAFVQRAKDLNPQAIYIWVPGGAQPAAVGKALAERGIDIAKIKILGQDALASEAALKSMGNQGLGIITVSNYDFNHQSPLNDAFVKAYNADFHRNPDFFSIGGYDGMHLIYAALQKTHGVATGEALIAAAKGMSWESPRGPMMIDPQTRDVVQTVYIRKVEKVGDELRNVDIDKIPNVKDPGNPTK